MTQAQLSEKSRHRTVLVVEDEEDLRELLRSALEMSGYSVVTAQDGQDALRKLDEHGSPCLILLDLVMPEMNGWQFLHEFRQRPEHTSVPVIVHSSATPRAPEGVTRVVQKPMSLEHLLNLVDEYC
jgi:two-component system chemotaxis response regulator CheY